MDVPLPDGQAAARSSLAGAKATPRDPTLGVEKGPPRTRPRPARILGAIVSFPARHVAWRIIAPYALLTLVFAATGTYLTTSVVAGSLQDRFDNRLLEAGRVASDSFVLQERKHLELARATSFTDGVAAATRDGDSETLAGLITPLAANSGIDRLQVFDARGTTVFATARSPSTRRYERMMSSGDPGGQGIVAEVLEGRTDASGNKFSGLVKTDSGFMLGTAAPVYDSDTLVGAVLVGTTLDSLLLAIKVSAIADVTLYTSDGRPIASTFAGGGLTKEADLDRTNAGAGRQDQSGVLKETRKLFGRDYSLVYATLKLRGQNAGLYSVAISNDFVTSAGGATAWRMALLFGFGTMVVFAIGWSVSRSLTQPILQLLRTARLVTKGDLTARSGLAKNDEIGALAGAFDSMTERLQQQHLATIRALTSAIDARDPYTLGHSVRVAQLAVELGRQVALPAALLQHIEIGGYLHDIGKIGIRDAVLLKAGSLTGNERKVIEDHPRIGLRILEAVELAPEVIEFVGGHHERLNGTGYPLGLQAEEISIIPRIAAVADVYDAVTTDRPYRRAMSCEEAIELLLREAEGGLLDTRIVATMKKVAGLWEERRRDDPSLQSASIVDWAAA